MHPNSNTQNSQSSGQNAPVAGVPVESAQAPVDLLRMALKQQNLPAIPASTGVALDQESRSVAATMRQSFTWAKSAGTAMLCTRLALDLTSQVLPLAMTWLGATAVPLAIQVQQTGKGLPTLFATMAGVLGLGLLQNLAGAGSRYLDVISNNRIFRRFHVEVLDAGTDLSPAMLDSPSVQDKITKVRENLGSLAGNVNSLLSASVQTIGLVVTAGSLAVVSPLLSGAVAMLGVLRVMYAYRFGNEQKVLEDILAEPRRQMWYSSWPLRDPEGILGIKDLLRAKELSKANVREMAEVDSASEFVHQRQVLRGLTVDTGVAMAAGVATTVGLLAYIFGSMTLKEALFLSAATSVFAAGVHNFTTNISTWVASKHFVDETMGLLALAAKSRGREAELPADQIKRYSSAPRIKIENVSVVAERTDKVSGLVQKAEILKKISLDIKPGEFIGIVGQSGAGKTTLIKLLLGALEAREGKVTIADKPISEIPLAEIRANSSYLPQSYWNYRGRSVYHNIVIGNPIWDRDADITAAVNNSGLAEIMRTNGFKLHTILGPEFTNGRNLSGGENQAVALARSLAKSGKLIVLDEPTSKLDPDIAERVVEHLRGLNDTTRVLVSHDMGLVRKCDRIVVIAKSDPGNEQSPGYIEACGTHKELLESSATYKRFFGKQAAKFS
jgi:ABC-type multidrug transport system fused ATPase/permease subunit